jgi:hypothetical protein
VSEDTDTLCIMYERNYQSLFWTLHTFNMGTTCHVYDVRMIFKLQPFIGNHCEQQK